MHPLTRLLRSALLGTCHRVIIPPADAATSEGALQHARAISMVQRLRSLPQLKAHCDVGVMDTRSDVAKWIRYENRSLRSDLKGARDKIALLQKYLGARGDHELKTWDLWRDLQGSETRAKDLEGEVGELKTALGSARSTAAAAAASSELARARAQAETVHRIAARREAASAVARAEAMEEAVNRMARQLADVASGTPADATGPRHGEVCVIRLPCCSWSLLPTPFAYVTVLLCHPTRRSGRFWDLFRTLSCAADGRSAPWREWRRVRTAQRLPGLCAQQRTAPPGISAVCATARC